MVQACLAWETQDLKICKQTNEKITNLKKTGCMNRKSASQCALLLVQEKNIGNPGMPSKNFYPIRLHAKRT
jgi:hypothetical protein